MSNYNLSSRNLCSGHSHQFRKNHWCIIITFFFLTVILSSNVPFNSNQSIGIQKPHTAIRTITGNVTMTGISDSYASIDDEVTVSGHAEKWNGAAWDAYVGEIFLVVNGDDTSYRDITTTSNSLGNFNLAFTIDDSFLVGPNSIQANTSQGGYDTNCSNFLTVTVVAGADIRVNYLNPTLTDSLNYPIQGRVYNDITRLPYSGLAFQMEFWYGNVGTGTQGLNITVNGDGTFSSTIPHLSQFSYYNLYWPGSAGLSTDTLQVNFNTISGIVVAFNSLPRIIYQNQTMTISGSVRQDSNSTIRLENSQATVSLVGNGLNEIIFTGPLTTGGIFSNPNFTVPTNITGTYAVRVIITSYYSNGVFESVPPGVLAFEQTVRIRQPTAFTNFPWEFIVIGVAVVGVVTGIFLLQRRLMKQRLLKDRSVLAKEIEDRLKNVRLLYQMGRVKEALAYLYVTYTEIAQFRHGIEKRSSQTTTEFAIVMVKEYGQNPQNIYPFIQEIEQVVYGGYPYNDQVFLHAIELFGRIYLELMEKPLPSFQL